MFKCILLPTDGSRVAAKAVKAGLALAKETGGRVIGYYALEAIPHAYYGDIYALSQNAVKGLERCGREAGVEHLAKVKKMADAAGVAFEAVMASVSSAHAGIVDAAKKHKCDVIFMASYGRSGVSRVIMGSVMQKVLTHSKVPVLVYR